jgi:hypothetical protein
VEPTVTDDLDILIAFESSEAQPKPALVSLGPVMSYLKDKGYSKFQREAVLIEGRAVQFIPVASDLDAEALARAEPVDVEINPAEGSVKTRVLRPEHIVATALRVDRAKDRLRIIQFLNEEAVDIGILCDLLRRHGLADAWRAFCRRAGIANPCEIKSPP